MGIVGGMRDNLFKGKDAGNHGKLVGCANKEVDIKVSNKD